MIDRIILKFSGFLMVLMLSTTTFSFGQHITTANDDIFSALQINEENKGEILLLQEASINTLVDRHKRINQKGLRGFRIQLYRGSGQQAREKVNSASQVFMNKFPSFDPEQVYAIYESPYFKLRVGDYRTKNEAFEFLYHLKEVFPNAYIVATNINFPKLESKQTSESTNTDEQ